MLPFSFNRDKTHLGVWLDAMAASDGLIGDDNNVKIVDDVNEESELNKNKVCRVNTECEKQQNYCKLMINSVIFFSTILLIILKVSIESFLFSQLLIVMIMFDVYYLFVLFKSNNLHWFHYDIIGIEGIISMAIPSPNNYKENKFQLIGSISELSSYPGSTSHYILNTTSSYTFIITVVFCILVLDKQYNYDYKQYGLKISTLFMICLASFGFLLAGHWCVFQSILSTIIHIIGFFMIFILSTIAIYIQQNANWFCIVCTIISIITFLIYGYIRHNYVRHQFADTRMAHKYSLYEILLELILVIIIQAQCLLFMWTVIHTDFN